MPNFVVEKTVKEGASPSANTTPWSSPWATPEFRDPALYAKVSVLVECRNAVKLPPGSTTTLVKA